MITRLLAGLSLVALLPAAAEEASLPDVMRIEGTPPFGTIIRLAEPEYPQALRTAKAKVFLDVSGRVTYTGALADASYSPGSEEAKLMIAPLRAVMRHWVFLTPTDNNCHPTEQVVKNRVWFDFDGEVPKLSVTHVPLSAHNEPPIIKVVERKQPRYPRSMQQSGWQSYVYTKVRIAPDGSVSDVVATAYPRQPGIDLSDFEKEARLSMAKWTFNAMPEIGRDRNACYTLVFTLR